MNSREMVSESGEIHVTHKTAYPFSKWKIAKIAREVGLRLVNEYEFYLSNYDGYTNKKGSGIYCDNSLPVGECSTFIFMKRSRIPPYRFV